MAPPTLTLDIPISSLPLRSSYSHSSEAVQLSCDTFTILPVAASPLPFAIDGDFTAGTPSGFAPEQVDGGSGAGAGISAHHEGWTWGATMSAGHEVAKATTPPPASLRQGSPSSPSVFTIPNPSPNSNSGRPLSPLSPSSLSGYSSIMPRSDSHRPKRVRKETAPKAASPPPPAPTSSSVTIEDAAFLTAMLVPPPPPPRRYRSKPKDHAPRPPNAWILYRSAQIQILKKDEELSRKPQSDISKLIGYMWRDESPEVRKYYEEQSAIKKAEHAAMYPGYTYRPQRRTAADGTPITKANVAPATPSTPTEEEVRLLNSLGLDLDLNILPPAPSPPLAPLATHNSTISPLSSPQYTFDFSVPSPFGSPPSLSSSMSSSLSSTGSSYFSDSTFSDLASPEEWLSYNSAATSPQYFFPSPTDDLTFSAPPLSAPAAVSSFNFDFGPVPSIFD